MVSLSRELARRGHDVKILTPCSRPEPEISDLEVLTFGRTVPLPTAGSIARISFSVWHEPRLRATLENERFDIVHVHEPLMPMFALMATYFSPSPTIGTFHAYNEGPGRGYIMWKPVLKRAAVRLSGRIAVSEPARQYVMRYFPADYEVIPNGIDVDRFATPARRPEIFRDDCINILFLGRLNEKRKGLRYLLGAYSMLKWEYPNLRLIVAGPGKPDPDSYRIMGERSINDVIFTGVVPHEELPGYFQSADVFCSPATGNESFGYVLAEAMAASRPIVATDIPGFATLVRDGREGLLVPPKDEHALADALRTLISDPALRARMGAAGRASVDDYRWDRVAGRVVNYYHSVLDRRGVPAPALA